MLRALGLTKVSTGDVLFNGRGLPGAGAIGNVNTCGGIATGNLGEVIIWTGGDGAFEGNGQWLVSIQDCSKIGTFQQPATKALTLFLYLACYED